MVMKTRPALKTDLPEVMSLFNAWGIPAKVVEYASETGIVVTGDDGYLMGACFLYMTNSPMSILDLFVVDKHLGKTEKDKVIDILLKDVIDLAKSLGFRAIMCRPRYLKSGDRLAKIGFKSSPCGVYTMEFNHG